MRRRAEVSWRRWIGAVIVGIGAFQLFDGVVNHKVLGIHQIRYGVDLLPYDLTWLGTAVLLVLAGLVVVRSARRSRSRDAA